jgi:hypothetical protein
MMRAPRFALALALACLVTVSHAAPPPTRVEVVGPRLLLGEVVPGAPRELADVDLGPAPAPNGHRVVSRSDIEDALRSRGLKAPSKLPASVKVVRRMRSLTTDDVARIVRERLAQTTLPRGLTLRDPKPTHGADVPDGWDSVNVELPRPERRAGDQTLMASVSLVRGSDVLSRFPVPIAVSLDLVAAAPDVARGARIMLMISRGSVEITSPATTAAGGDVGETIAVFVPSGRTFKAKLVDKDHATMVEAR